MSTSPKGREVFTYRIELTPVDTKINPECPADCRWIKMKMGCVDIDSPATPISPSDIFPPGINGSNNKRVLAAQAYVPIDETVRAFEEHCLYVPRTEVLSMLSGKIFRASCRRFALHEGCAFNCRTLPK